jgi:hypothetical protein
MSEYYGVCEVCDKEPAVGIASSGLGPCSCAYCSKCLKQGAEPLKIMLATLACLAPADQIEKAVAPWVKEVKSFKDGRYIAWPEIVEIYKQEAKS